MATSVTVIILIDVIGMVLRLRHPFAGYLPFRATVFGTRCQAFPFIDSPGLKYGFRTCTGGFIKSDRTFRLTMMNNRAFSVHLMFRTEDDDSFTFVTPGTSWSGFWQSRKQP